MTTKRKWIGLSAAVILSLSLAGYSFAATNPFKDLENVSAKDKIISLQEQGYVHGISSERFLPDGTLTAAQGIQLIVNALDLNIDTLRFYKQPLATDYYPKADNNAWYAETLIIAANNGVGIPTEFEPDKTWTREKFAHQLILAIEHHNHLPMIKIIPVEIKDQDEMTADYEGSIQRALKFGIISLDAEGKFNPKADITRAESAEMIYNALEYLKAHPAPTPAPTKVN